MGARMREDNGRGRGLGVGDDRFFTPLRCVQNDMRGALRCVQDDVWLEEGEWLPGGEIP